MFGFSKISAVMKSKMCHVRPNNSLEQTVTSTLRVLASADQLER
jgi:hypothetical protein